MTASDLALASVIIRCISLPSAQKQRERVVAGVAKLGLDQNFSFFDAVDGKTLDLNRCLGEGKITLAAKLAAESGRPCYRGSMTRGFLGCSLSHAALWAECKERRKPILILEDDATFADDLASAWADIARNAPDDWQILYLSVNPYDWCVGRPVAPGVVRLTQRVHGMGAMLVRPSAVHWLLQSFPLTLGLDHDLPDKLIATELIRAYLVGRPGLATNRWSADDMLVLNYNVDNISTTQNGLLVQGEPSGDTRVSEPRTD